MFEALAGRVRQRAETRADAHREELAARLAGGLPRGVRVVPSDAGVRLEGRKLGARYVLDAGLRRLASELLR